MFLLFVLLNSFYARTYLLTLTSYNHYHHHHHHSNNNNTQRRYQAPLCGLNYAAFNGYVSDTIAVFVRFSKILCRILFLDAFAFGIRL